MTLAGLTAGERTVGAGIMVGFLFVPYSASGHVNPMLPVMADLVSRGESVYALVGARFFSDVQETGAYPIRLDHVPDVYVPDRPTLRTVARVVRDRSRRPSLSMAASRVLQSELHRTKPELMVIDPVLGWAERAACRSSVPTAMFSTTFATNRHAAVIVNGWGKWAHRWRPMVRRYERSPQLLLVHALPALQPARHTFGASTLFTGPLVRDPTGSLPFAKLSSRMLLVSPGTVFARDKQFFIRIAQAFAGSEWTVLMATGHLDPVELDPLPANVIAERELPQRMVLKECDLFLTHAGMNSVLEALANGVPMALAPRSAEQRFLASRVAELGVGVSIEVGKLTPAELYQKLMSISENAAIRAAALRLREQLASAPGAPVVAEALLAFARGPRAVTPASEARPHDVGWV